MRSIKEECLSPSESRRYVWAVTAYLAHYHAERNHQGLDNELIQPGVRGSGCRRHDRAPRLVRRNVALLSSPSGMIDFPMIDWLKQRLAA